MIYIEMPTWLMVLLAIGYILLLIHALVGNLLGKITYRYLKEKEETKDEIHKN